MQLLNLLMQVPLLQHFCNKTEPAEYPAPKAQNTPKILDAEFCDSEKANTTPAAHIAIIPQNQWKFSVKALVLGFFLRVIDSFAICLM